MAKCKCGHKAIQMKLELDIQAKDETAIRNFFRESKYLILLAKDGASKVVVLENET